MDCYIARIDLLIPLKKGAIQHIRKRITAATTIIGEKESVESEIDDFKDKYIEIPFTKLAIDIGDKVYANIIASGVILGLFRVDLSIINQFLTKMFSKKGDKVVQKNREALKSGYDIGEKLLTSGKITVDFSRNMAIKEGLVLTGVETVGLGAIAGGCNYIAAYPMSPSTGVLIFLSQQSKDFDIIAEQAEDEISAINMALGAWYAGARGMVNTSGGGFALMVEGLSLAGMIESPLVIHLGQRPGPATGLPTRTEQADLLFALHAGHGEFPRIILAPGSIQDGFYLTQKAFNLADKYQVPVFLLTDQYFLDSTYVVSAPFNLAQIKIDKKFIKTMKKYKRYRFTDTGVSPRGIPGFGEGLVAVDSDEHDEEGHITEDHDVRIKMVQKRLKKLEFIKKDIIPPELIGAPDYKVLLVCWGSTYYSVKEALKILGRKDIAALHFKQVYPLHSDTLLYLKKAQKTVIIENNATAQFRQLIKLQTAFEIENTILNYNGLPFSVEEIIEKVEGFLK